MQVLDMIDSPLEEGVHVQLAGVEGLSDAARTGVVTSVSDPESDVDEDGRPCGVNPRVAVLFFDGVDDEFLTVWHGGDATYCEDVVVVARPDVFSRVWWALQRRAKGARVLLGGGIRA